MDLTHITDADPFDPDVYSGALHCLAKGLQHEEIQLRTLHVTLPQKLLPAHEELIFLCKRFWARFYHGAHLSPHLFTRRAQHIANMLNHSLRTLKTDAILTTLSPLCAPFLETKVPIVYWTDHVYAAIATSHPHLRSHHPDTHWDAHYINTACLHNATLLIFSTQWAARSAIELYGISKHKIKVVPFGANLDISHSLVDVKNWIKARSRTCIKLLFVAKKWAEKGGDIVLEVASALHAAGYPVEVTIVGCTPSEESLPSYVKCENFLSKKNAENIKKLMEYYKEAHFLFVPSLAESFGIVFCEANALGVPCISTYVGGISDVVKDGVNGMTFSLEATVKEYCDYIVNTWENSELYEALALSAFNEYETRLNWKTSCREVKKLISEII